MDSKLVFDHEEALRRTEGDEELLADLVDILLTDVPLLLADIRQAAALGDGPALLSSAHSFKGSAGTLGAHLVFDAALTLEQMGRCENLEGVEEAYAALQQQVETLLQVLAAWRAPALPGR